MRESIRGSIHSLQSLTLGSTVGHDTRKLPYLCYPAAVLLAIEFDVERGQKKLVLFVLFYHRAIISYRLRRLDLDDIAVKIMQNTPWN